jgi:gamma-D-glutamyl-L-lysine dipeptidyl-peptidase
MALLLYTSNIQRIPPMRALHVRSMIKGKFVLSLFLVLTLASVPGFTKAWPQTAGTSSPSPSQLVAKSDYVVIKPVANMYRDANRLTDVVSQAIYGSNVTRVKSKHGWVNVRTTDQYTGWIPTSDLRKLKGQAYATSGAVARISQLSANLYREPDVTKHAPLLTLPWEVRLEVLPNKVPGDQERWLQVRLPDSSTAFVQVGDVSTDFTPLTVDQMIATAKKFLGVTYTWGGSSDFGFDCSGFTQMLMRQRGIIMPRDADLQAAWTGVAPIERANLQPGDLLFFGGGPEHITHTGLYIGEGKFIHDTTHEHPGVQISTLDDKPWTTLLVAARRVKS